MMKFTVTVTQEGREDFEWEMSESSNMGVLFTALATQQEVHEPLLHFFINEIPVSPTATAASLGMNCVSSSTVLKVKKVPASAEQILAPTADAYAVLGCSRGIVQANINKVYRDLALKWHPDRHVVKQNSRASEVMQRINEAYHAISEVTTRIAYNEAMWSIWNAGSPGSIVNVLRTGVYGRILEAVGKLGNGITLELPKIVVVGMESEGKSSVLERIAMREVFPRDRLFCTRVAIKLMLRNCSHENSVKLRLVNVTSGKVETDANGVRLEKEIYSSRCDEGDDHSAGIADVMRSFIKSVHSDDDDRTVLTGVQIEIEVRAPNVVTLDLVDLPGIVTAPEAAAKATQEITKRFLDDRLTLVVCVVSGRSESLRNNTVLPMLKALRGRSVVALTKVDVGGDLNLFERMQLGGDVPQDLGITKIVPLVNRDTSIVHEGTNPSIRAAQLLEEQWFGKWCGDRCMVHDKEAFGITGLTHSLNQLLLKYMREQWAPSERRHLQQLRWQTTTSIHNLGDPIPEEGLPSLPFRQQLSQKIFDAYCVFPGRVEIPTREDVVIADMFPIRNSRYKRALVRSTSLTHFHSQAQLLLSPPDSVSAKNVVQQLIAPIESVMRDASLPFRFSRFLSLRAALCSHLEASIVSRIPNVVVRLRHVVESVMDSQTGIYENTGSLRDCNRHLLNLISEKLSDVLFEVCVVPAVENLRRVITSESSSGLFEGMVADDASEREPLLARLSHLDQAEKVLADLVANAQQ